MYRYFKRIIDILFSFLMIIILIPVLIIISLCIVIIMGRPVLFRQKRIGLHNREFEIIKYRTMRIKSHPHATDTERITKLGRFLRVSRIDEFPQLFNILFGEMSFIGPRPLLPDYLPYYTKEELLRHQVRPGLSGLSQVSGSYLKWEDQFKLDLEYIQNLTAKTDLKILIKTVKKVLNPSKKLVTGNSERSRFDIHRMRQIEELG
jgi:lipopolysaccharide/colanic/teichoic acid biosynthesis glycosyltransferase